MSGCLDTSQRQRRAAFSPAVGERVAALQESTRSVGDRRGSGSSNSPAVEAERFAAFDSARTHLSEVGRLGSGGGPGRCRRRGGSQATGGSARRGSTTTTAGSTTTTARPPTSAATRVRRRAVETDRYRSLRRLGLDGTKCETRNGIEFCVSGQVDIAMRTMACEAMGFRLRRTRSSAAGLFQNRPTTCQRKPGGSECGRIHSFKSRHIPLRRQRMEPGVFVTPRSLALLVWESRETILGNRGGSAVSPAVWPGVQLGSASPPRAMATRDGARSESLGSLDVRFQGRCL